MKIDWGLVFLTLFVVVVVFWLGFSMYFFWTHCAFVKTANTPGMCWAIGKI